MRTLDLQRRWDLTLHEVAALRERHSGMFGHQPGVMVRQKSRRFAHEYTGDLILTRNLVVNEGLNHILNVELNALAALTVWYLTGFSDNITPLATHDYAVPGTTEITTTNVAEAVRETYNANASTSESIDNVAGPVAQYIADNTFTMFGMQLMAGSSAFGDVTDDATHIMYASTLLTPQRDMIALDTLDMIYTFPSQVV